MSDAFAGKSVAPRGTPVMWVRPPDRPGPKRSWPDLAIRDGNWKLLVFRDGSKPELYNLAADSVEKFNVAADHPEIAAKLSRQVIDWDRQTTAH
jgi:hypothetical protein